MAGFGGSLCATYCFKILGADQVGHLAHLNRRGTTLAYASRAPQADISRLKARMGWNTAAASLKTCRASDCVDPSMAELRPPRRVGNPPQVANLHHETTSNRLRFRAPRRWC